LDRIDLTIQKGEIFALLGPNGAGKTTLISIIASLVRRSSGTVEVMGFDLDRDPLKVRACIGLVPQELNYDPFFNVNEVLRFMMGYFGRRPEQSRIDALLTTFDLMDKKYTNTRELSGGMKRRLLIAKALIHDPPLVFLDEPTAGVDVELREELWRYIKGLRDRGTTIVLTTHYLREAERLADRIGILDKGKLLRIGTREELLREFGEQVLIFDVDKPLDPLPLRLKALGVEQENGGRRLVYRYQDGNGRLDELLDFIRNSGISVLQIQDRHTHLEDVFLKLLGRQTWWFQ
jgi:ABC-2 type transport system ATP-binding protein